MPPIPRSYHPTPAECLRLVQSDPTEPSAIEYDAFFSVIYATGATLTEMSELKVGDVRVDADGNSWIRLGRRNEMPLIAGPAELLGRFIDTVGRRRPDVVFVHGSKGSLRNYFVKELHRRGRAIGLPGPVSLSGLRASFARHMSERGVKVEDLQILLGMNDIGAVIRLSRAR